MLETSGLPVRDGAALTTETITGEVPDAQTEGATAGSAGDAGELIWQPALICIAGACMLSAQQSGAHPAVLSIRASHPLSASSG